MWSMKYVKGHILLGMIVLLVLQIKHRPVILYRAFGLTFIIADILLQFVTFWVW